MASRERLARLVAALETLPHKTRTIFRLHKFDGVSYADIASQLDISRSSVEKHMMEAPARPGPKGAAMIVLSPVAERNCGGGAIAVTSEYQGLRLSAHIQAGMA